MSLGITASVNVELHAPIAAGTLSFPISFSAVATASVGWLLSRSCAEFFARARRRLHWSAAIAAPSVT
jgi:hypothetical protein